MRSKPRRPGSSPYERIAGYYDQIYSWKEYRTESSRVRVAIRRYGPGRARTLVDVGCGTGEHLRYLRRWYDCRGIDRSPAMLRVARRKLPGLALLRGTFGGFHLAEPVDVLTCLFSAIGYLRTERELRAAFRNFYRNLAPGGVALIEPWITPETYRGRLPHLLPFTGRDRVIARVNVPTRRGLLMVTDMHYLIGDRHGVRYLRDHHVVRMTPIPRLVELLRTAGFRVRFLRRGLPLGRGLLIAVRPDSPTGRAGAPLRPGRSRSIRRAGFHSTGRT